MINPKRVNGIMTLSKQLLPMFGMRVCFLTKPGTSLKGRAALENIFNIRAIDQSDWFNHVTCSIS